MRDQNGRVAGLLGRRRSVVGRWRAEAHPHPCAAPKRLAYRASMAQMRSPRSLRSALFAAFALAVVVALAALAARGERRGSQAAHRL